MIKKLRLDEKSNFDNITKAADYYYPRWKSEVMDTYQIRDELARLGHNDDFIDATIELIFDKYDDDQRYWDEYDESVSRKKHIKRLKEDSLDDIIKPEIEKRYIWPLYEDSAYEITEIIEKYQNSNRFKDEIKSFDFKDIEYRDWPALQLELVCSTEAYVLIRKDIEREGLYMDDDEFDESLKLKESSDYYDTPDNEYATFMGDTIPEEEPDKSYKHSLTVPEDRIEDFARFVADYFNEDFNDIVNNESDVIWMDDFDSYGNRYITIVCSDEEYKEIEGRLNKKSLRTKNESYPRYKKSYERNR